MHCADINQEHDEMLESATCLAREPITRQGHERGAAGARAAGGGARVECCRHVSTYTIRLPRAFSTSSVRAQVSAECAARPTNSFAEKGDVASLIQTFSCEHSASSRHLRGYRSNKQVHCTMPYSVAWTNEPNYRRGRVDK